MKNLSDIRPGECATVKKVTGGGDIHRRLIELGLTPGARVECVGKSLGGDPKAFIIRGAVIAIRAENCRCVAID